MVEDLLGQTEILDASNRLFSRENVVVDGTDRFRSRRGIRVARERAERRIETGMKMANVASSMVMPPTLSRICRNRASWFTTPWSLPPCSGSVVAAETQKRPVARLRREIGGQAPFLEKECLSPYFLSPYFGCPYFGGCWRNLLQ